jgi:hypothetical protein
MIPKQGQVYVSYKNRHLYRIVDVVREYSAFEYEEIKQKVLLQSIESKNIYSIPLSDFNKESDEKDLSSKNNKNYPMFEYIQTDDNLY